MADAVIRYLRERQSPGGGFCFYRSEYLDEPNISDSYHAVRTLHLLGAEVRAQDALRELAQSFLHSPHALARYYAVLLLRTLDPDFRPSAQWCAQVAAWPFPALPASDSPGLSNWLEQARILARLKSLFADAAELAEPLRGLRQLEHPEGGFGKPPNLWDSWLALDMLRRGEAAGVCLPRTREFIERLQVPFIGFSLTEGSLTANLDVLFAGLRCCRALGLAVRFAPQLKALIQACQSGKGGYARAPGASPNIEYTYKAIWALCCLDNALPS